MPSERLASLWLEYTAPNEDMIRKHAEKAGIPANKISEVKVIIESSMAEYPK
jgi:cell division inhibitor SulA